MMESIENNIPTSTLKNIVVTLKSVLKSTIDKNLITK
jgi:hypothetical protein